MPWPWRGQVDGPPARPGLWGLGLAVVAVGWVWAGPALVPWLYGAGGRTGMVVVATAWLLGFVAYVVSRRREHRARLASMFLGLTIAGTLALLLSAVQVLPVLEHIAASLRWAAARPEDLYDSSLLPYRIVEWIWPNVFGTFTAGNHYWMPILPPAGAARPSPLSLYAGALPLVLALGASGFRGGPPWRAWITAVALLSLWASLGEFAGPARWSAAEPSPSAGDGSFYGLLATSLPALRLFRFPFKLLVFTALGLSVLAGAGWDRVAAGVGRRRTIAIAIGLLALTVLAASSVAAMRERLVAAVAARELTHAVFGPLDAPAAVGELLRGLAHGAIALTLGLIVLAGSAGPVRAVHDWVEHAGEPTRMHPPGPPFVRGEYLRASRPPLAKGGRGVPRAVLNPIVNALAWPAWLQSHSWWSTWPWPMLPW